MEIQRETIFVAAIRSFSKMFMGICGLLLGLGLMFLLYSSFGGGPYIEPMTEIEYLPDATNKRVIQPASSPVVLQINIHGVIGEVRGGGPDTESVEHVLIDSREGLLADGRVKAILLHMNTPGGTVTDSDNIYRMIMAYKEQYKVPVFAYVDGLCASGGMYISSSADQVFAGSSSLIGSVGVIIGPFFNIYDVMTGLGVKSETITQGLNKDMMSPFREWKPNEDAALRNVTKYYYNQFVDIVTNARHKMDKTKLINEYGAKIFDPQEALAYGYIDYANASRNDALLALLKEANIDPSAPYQVVSLNKRASWMSAFSGLVSGQIEHTIDTGYPKLKERIAYLYQQ